MTKQILEGDGPSHLAMNAAKLLFARIGGGRCVRAMSRLNTWVAAPQKAGSDEKVAPAYEQFRRLRAVAGILLVCVCSPVPLIAQTSSTASSPRRIPVRGYSAPSSADSRILKEKPGVQPGRVTSVEIRNADGEVMDSELAEGEYFMGAAPLPIAVGQSLPTRMASSPSMALESPFLDDPEVIVGEEYADPEVLEFDEYSDFEGSQMFGDSIDGGCDACDAATTGVCDSCHYGDGYYGPYDARVEHLARFLAHPLAGFWARAEYANLTLDGQGAPPLVTTGDPGTPLANAGVLGQSGTRTLYGGNELGDGSRSGGRFEIGRYFGASGLGLSASILFADDVDDQFSADSSTYAILARPYVDVSPGGMGSDADLVSFPAQYAGSVNVQSSTQFAAGDVLLRAMLISRADRQLESLVGYTYLQLDDVLNISDSTRILGSSSGLGIGTLIDRTDRFQATNRFNGAAFGVRTETSWGRWSLASMLKLGIGRTSSTVKAYGLTRTTGPAVDIQNGGLLVQSSNMGSRDYSEFAVSPELRLMLSRQLPYGWNASVGYHFLYLSRVLRAGEQIDPYLNLTQASPGGLQGFASPRPDVYYSDLTANAITFGVMRNF